MKKHAPLPPGLFLRFFRWFCHPSLRDPIEGDLMELYHERLKNGKGKADFKFIIDVILLFRPGIIRPTNPTSNPLGMYSSYFKIGWRNLARNKGYSIINIGGLAIGMTVALLNGLWIWDEFSFNKYHERYDRIAQVVEIGTEDGNTWTSNSMTYPLGTELLTNYRQHFENIVRMSWTVDCILSAGEKKFSAKGFYTDAETPEMFSFNMIRGTRGGLKDAHAILINASLAENLFGTSDPVNQTIRINNKMDLTVAGVYEDFPQNTKFAGVKFFGTWESFLLDQPWIEKRALNDWRNHFLQVYGEIKPGSDFRTISEKIGGAIRFDPQDKERAIKGKAHIGLYPMSQWHLYPFRRGLIDREPVKMVWLVGAIGSFVLMLACINFMNLSTARSERRAKEVGIRKTVGSIRSQLINQFFTESFMVVLFAFAISLLAAVLFLPGFNDVAGKDIQIPWSNSLFWASGFSVVIVTSLLAGSYPALYLSSFKPVKVLKGTFKAGKLASMPRKVLVVLQFSISVVLIISTVVVYQQIQYAKNRPVGYDQKGLISISKRSGDFYGKYDVLRNELKNTGAVIEISESMGQMTEVVSGNNGWDWKGKDPAFDQSFNTLSVSHDHGKTVGWQFIQGRDFSRELDNDSSGLVLNESAARIMNLDHPIGEPVAWTWWTDKRVLNYKIIGVIKDPVMNNPYMKTEPTVFYLKGFNGKPSWINIKINPNISMAEALPKIEAVFKKIIPMAPFDYKFVDDEYAMKFAAEERVGKLALIFTVLAVFISCLGLLGLSSFVAEQRTKEIGIRKILGASPANLWRLLSKDFVFLVIIACAFSVPAASYFLNGWLEKYQYRIEISGWTFAATCGTAMVITLLTVSFQALKGAYANPVNSLRAE